MQWRDESERSEAAVETVARAFAAGHVVWLGTGGGLRSETGASWERAAFATRGMDGADLAVLLWCCGLTDASVRSNAHAALLLDGSAVKLRDEREERPWPRGRLLAMVDLALHELSPAGQRQGLSDDERVAWIARVDRHPPMRREHAWSRGGWRERYREVLSAGWRRESNARLRIAGGADRVTMERVRMAS